jgi:hypothetical protein
VARLLVGALRLRAYSTTQFIIGIDDDDPNYEEYYEIVGHFDPSFARVVTNPRSSIVAIMNQVSHAMMVTHECHLDVIGFMGDDHLPQTQFWDDRLGNAALHVRGVAYGNDLIQGENLPTAVAVDARVIETLGFMAPPTMTHLYVDNFWKDLGQAIDGLIYLPDVIIEHMHPIAGKSSWDDGYKRVNGGEMYQRDAEAYAAYRQVNFANDVSKLIAARSAW